MLLAVDCGNTNIACGLFQNKKISITFRMATDTKKMPEEYSLLFGHFFSLKGIYTEDVKAAVVANVVPAMTRILTEAIKEAFQVEPHFITIDNVKELKIKIDKPDEVGADRYANVVAAQELYKAPALVIDFGTATTFDALSAKGEYLGGAITPGIEISRDALFEKAAKLPKVELADTKELIGGSTVDAIRSGILWGTVSMVEGMITRFKKKLGAEAKVIATGGDAQIIASETKMIDKVDPNLTLEGLRLLWEQM